jgi:hypothetical protein
VRLVTQDRTRASYDAVAAAYAVESLTRREPYPGAEVATPRAYFLARAV